ncbi:PREDICTED: period circadian protein homolog 1-like [Thamnophis sirtalis]|uniref:Period circadian protein homolog 1-like n=1 Tax=Thamnophis sirtalis TaxID=35019 RepID=A0A6I9YVK5_9SAUR|nr:PREDICTED: period circadian protein homolog 1-like [Thamnophis sirtalis]
MELLLLLLMLLISQAVSGKLRKKCLLNFEHQDGEKPWSYYKPGDHLFSFITTATKIPHVILPFTMTPEKQSHLSLSTNKSRILRFIFAIQVVNKTPKLLHNLTLAYNIHDNYFNTLATSDALLDMLSTGEANVPNYSCGKKDNLLALLDGASSDISIQMSTLVGPYKVPQLSDKIVSEALSDKSQFPFFHRMFPIIGFHYPGIVQLLLHFRWTVIGLFALDTGNGEHFMRTFTPMLERNGICVVISQRFSTTGYTGPLRDAISMWRQVNVFVHFIEYAPILDIISLFHSMLDGLPGPIEGKVWIMTTLGTYKIKKDRPLKYIHSIWTFAFQEKKRPNDFFESYLYIKPQFEEQSFQCLFSKHIFSVKGRKRCTQKATLETKEEKNSIQIRYNHHFDNVIKTMAQTLNAAYSSRSRRRRKESKDMSGPLRLQPWQFNRSITGTPRSSAPDIAVFSNLLPHSFPPYRYLESCNIPSRVKRKCGSSSYTTSSNSDDDKQKVCQQVAARSKNVPEERLPATERQSEREEPGVAASAATAVGGPLTPLALPTSKAESVVSVTSQCSFSSTIVHVGDKKPPESDIVMMEETAPSATPPAPLPGVTPDREQQYRRVGLTKEVLSVHTQKEEHSFLTRFKDLSQLHVFNSPSRHSWQELHHPRAQDQRGLRCLRPGLRGLNIRGRSRKSKAKRIRQNKSSDSTSTPQNSVVSPPQLPCSPAASSWAPTGPSPPTLPNMSYPAVMPTYPIPVFSPRPTAPTANEPSHNPLSAPQFPAPLVAPMVALVLPNYVFPQINNPLPQTYFPGSPVFPFGPPQPGNATLAPRPEASLQVPSHSSTPHSMSQPERAESPRFESRCSSPLQLNLLQMEELLKPSDRQDAVLSGQAAGPAGTSADWVGVIGGQGLGNELGPPQEACMVSRPEDKGLHSLRAESPAGGRVQIFDYPGEDTASSKSSNTSKYFGSIDSSENDLRAKKRSEAEDNEHFMKYVLQDPIWLLMANTDDKVMMTYQLPTRDMETVLQEDREKLKQLQKQQPRFTEDQKRELAEVHTWLPKGVLPKAINVTACIECESNATSRVSPLYDLEIQDMDLSGMLEPMEEGNGAQVSPPSLPLEIAMEEEEAGESRDQAHRPEAEAQETS